MGIGGIVREIHRRDAVLSTVGWIQVVALAGVAIAGCFDLRTVTGINPWIKPAKFYIATTIFLWTIAWFIVELQGKKTWLRWGFGAAMLIENSLITMQDGPGNGIAFQCLRPT